MPSQRDGTMAQAPAQVQDSWVDDVFVLFPGVNSNSSFPLLSCAGDSWDGSYPDLQSSTKFMMQWSSVRNIQSVSVCFSFRFLPFIPLVQMYALYLQATHLSNPFNIFSVTLCHSVTVFKKIAGKTWFERYAHEALPPPSQRHQPAREGSLHSLHGFLHIPMHPWEYTAHPS